MIFGNVLLNSVTNTLGDKAQRMQGTFNQQLPMILSDN